MIKTNPAFGLLKQDHEKVKQLFKQFEAASGRPAKKKIAMQAIQELSIHAVIEEEIFYPAVRKAAGNTVTNEATEEHHAAKVMIAELSEMKGNETYFEAKFKVLAENVKRHIGEEETALFSIAQDTGINFQDLFDRMTVRKGELQSDGVPETAEAVMVSAMHGMGDSSAQAAEKAQRALKTRSAGGGGEQV